MLELTGKCDGYALLLHGGAGPQDPDSKRLKGATDELVRIGETGMKALDNNQDPMDVVVQCLKDMELCERFNAGIGSALQADGQARLTAALMESDRETFSGVISASYVNHPSVMARHLQSCSSRVLTSPGTELLARKLGLKMADNLSPDRIRKWAKRVENGETFCDTVGCIIRTPSGRLVGGTSTGGRGMEFPGRVSDSATVAGTYVTKHLAACATGIGEEIVDDALCARLETRIRDGSNLKDASHKCLEEAQKKDRSYGWLGLTADGSWTAATTTKAMSFAVFCGDRGLINSSINH
jgi:L-asparaginase